MSLAIEARGLTRVYRGSRKRAGIRAVDGADLQVEPGEVLALLGPNGAGKTTMVRLLTCLLRPSEGTARVAGHDIRESPGRVRALCGVSTETPGLYERLTAREYLAFFARLYSVAEAEIASRTRTLLEAADLWDRRDDRLATFSKGMRQKMNIGRALLHRPPVVFFDEPTSGLDVESARAVRQQIQALSRGTDTAFVICTHNLPEAERLCTRIAVMDRGRIVARGTPGDLKDRLFGGQVMQVRLRQVLPEHREAVASLPGVRQVRADGDRLLIHISAPEEEVNPVLVRRLVESGAQVVSFSSEGRSLEEVYLHLVHREAQEEGQT